LATRVRIEILKAMAKKFGSEKEELYVIGYASRPVLHIKSGGNSRWLGFLDALVRYGSGLEEPDLGDAYKKAGIAFRGQLQQNFVVLHDGYPEQAQAQAQDKVEKTKTGRVAQIAMEVDVRSPRKRLRDEPELEQVAKKLVGSNQ
jgi:hypothetical protein